MRITNWAIMFKHTNRINPIYYRRGRSGDDAAVQVTMRLFGRRRAVNRILPLSPVLAASYKPI